MPRPLAELLSRSWSTQTRERPNAMSLTQELTCLDTLLTPAEVAWLDEPRGHAPPAEESGSPVAIPTPPRPALENLYFPPPAAAAAAAPAAAPATAPAPAVAAPPKQGVSPADVTPRLNVDLHADMVVQHRSLLSPSPNGKKNCVVQ